MFEEGALLSIVLSMDHVLLTIGIPIPSFASLPHLKLSLLYSI